MWILDYNMNFVFADLTVRALTNPPPQLAHPC